MESITSWWTDCTGHHTDVVCDLYGVGFVLFLFFLTVGNSISVANMRCGSLIFFIFIKVKLHGKGRGKDIPAFSHRPVMT